MSSNKGWGIILNVNSACCGLSLWLSGLIPFLSHSTCWALLADNLWWPGFKSRSGHEFSVGWTNGRYAVGLISLTGTEGPTLNCDRCCLWSYDIMAGYKCAYYIIVSSSIVWVPIHRCAVHSLSTGVAVGLSDSLSTGVAVGLSAVASSRTLTCDAWDCEIMSHCGQFSVDHKCHFSVICWDETRNKHRNTKDC